MNRNCTLLWMVPLLLGFSGAWADEHDEESAALPEPAAEEARNTAELRGAAAGGLEIASEETSGLPAEATIRLMGAHDAELPDEVTREIDLPALPEDTAAVEAAADGFAAAEAGIARRDEGLGTAADALETAADMAEDALNNVEDRGRAEDLPVDVPGRPDMPDVPDVPQPPTG